MKAEKRYVRQDFFMYNNRKIECGQIIKFRRSNCPLWRDLGEEVTFLWYHPIEKVYWIISHPYSGYNTYGLSEENFERLFIGPTNKVNQYEVEKRQKELKNKKSLLGFLKRL